MTIDSVHLRYAAPPARSASPVRDVAGSSVPKPAATAGPAAAAPQVDTVELSVPAEPPPDVMEQVSAAARCAAELARNNRELHFRADEHSSRIIIEVRDMSGNVLRTIPPSKAVDLLTAGPGRDDRWLA